MKADAATERAVKAVLDKVAEAYATRNMDMLLATLAPDPDVTMYGTGADEKRVGRSAIKAQAERDWSQTDSATVRYDEISVSAAGPVAWAAADGAFVLKAGGRDMILPVRITSVLEKRGALWLLVQSHYSFPALDQAEGEAFPT